MGETQHTVVLYEAQSKLAQHISIGIEVYL
jgi:hypothetical protein